MITLNCYQIPSQCREKEIQKIWNVLLLLLALFFDCWWIAALGSWEDPTARQQWVKKAQQFLQFFFSGSSSPSSSPSSSSSSSSSCAGETSGCHPLHLNNIPATRDRRPIPKEAAGGVNSQGLSILTRIRTTTKCNKRNQKSQISKYHNIIKKMIITQSNKQIRNNQSTSNY